MKPSHAAPGRPREFDVADAIADAQAVFAQRGYAATSLPDLMQGMGLSKGSLYKAFASKHAIYLAALDRYMRDGLARLAADLERQPAIDAIQTVLRHYAALSSGAAGEQGCLVVAAACERLPHDEEAQAKVAGMLERMRTMLTAAIRRAQAEGDAAANQDPEQLSRFLLCVIEGMRVLGKAGQQEPDMQAIAAIAVNALRP